MRLSHTVGHVGRRPDQGSGSGFAGLASHHHARVPREDQVKFVRAGMGVELLGLAGLETVEALEHRAAAREVRLGGLGGVENGALTRLEEELGHI